MATKKAQITGLIMVKCFIILFFCNSLIIYLASLIFPQAVVLGTANITVGWALIHCGISLALINTFALPFFGDFTHSGEKTLTPKQWLAAYFVVDFVGLWVISRFAEQLGMGLSSWFVALILAIILAFAQGAALYQVEKSGK